MEPTRAQVIAVIADYKEKGPKEFLSVYRYRGSTKYDLCYGGHRYPPKAIYNVAWKKARGQNDKTGTVSRPVRGSPVNQPLELLGFKIVGKDKEEVGLDEPDGAVDDYTRRSIAQRRGQAKFRSMLITAYGNCCAVTGCVMTEILEACHVRPYSGFADYKISNGILLRTDIHTLFDLSLIKIDPASMRVRVHKSITDQFYRVLDGKVVRRPKIKSAQLNKKFLTARWKMPV